MEFDPSQHPHRRRNPLTGEFVLVSPHRSLRPWQGQTEGHSVEKRPSHDPNCYLCPGGTRASGEVNPEYADTYAFVNDFAALLPLGRHNQAPEGLLPHHQVSGECRVLCFSPRHDLTLAEMPAESIERVVDLWAAQSAELGGSYQYVQVFENKGEAMGCSNPHPHGQVWASDFIPNVVESENQRQADYFRDPGTPLLLQVLKLELGAGKRVVDQNAHWVLLVPFWATWPFEYLLLPRRHVLRLPDLTPEERKSLATILKSGLVRYDNLFGTSFPYSMGWHQAPFNESRLDHWQLHAHFYPPLLRSASIKKFMVGYEMLGEAQRDITPEQAADRLRDCSSKHYKQA